MKAKQKQNTHPNPIVPSFCLKHLFFAFCIFFKIVLVVCFVFLVFSLVEHQTPLGRQMLLKLSAKRKPSTFTRVLLLFLLLNISFLRAFRFNQGNALLKKLMSQTKFQQQQVTSSGVLSQQVFLLLQQFAAFS